MSTNAPNVFVLDRRAPGDEALILLENARLHRELREETRRRHEAEARLERSEAYLAEVQTLSRTGSFGWNVTTQELYCSDEIYRLLGFDPHAKPTFEEVRSRMHPDDVASLTAIFDSSDVEAGTKVDFEQRALLPDGSLKRFHLVARAVRNVRAELEFVGAAMDVTEQRQAQLDLERSEVALGKLRSEFARVARLTSLGVLAAAIAHEVNQPLSGIVINAGTCLRMLAAGPPDLDGARETARRMIRDGGRAAQVIARLRALFVQDDSTSPWVDLNDATREVLALSLNELQKNRVVLRLELASELALVRGDRVQLQQVIVNLVTNASDAMSGVDDRPRLLVVRTEADEGEGVRLSVEDAGVGLEPENVDRVFEAFYSTKTGGMGIGLSVSRSIIESHRGRLWAKRNQGPGTTFAFAVPVDPTRA